LITELFSTFFDSKVSLAQHEIFFFSNKLYFSLIKNKQRFLIKSFSARILAVRNCIDLGVSHTIKSLSSKEKFTIVSLLQQRKDLYKHYNYYVVKNNGISFSSNFFTIYCISFCYLIELSILPFLEAKLDKFFFTFFPYKNKSDVVLTMNDIFLNEASKLWYLKFKILTTLNYTNKLWLLKNFPLENFFLNFCFESKNYFFCKSFYSMIFNYLLKELV
jgi:hypothetical protein